MQYHPVQPQLAVVETCHGTRPPVLPPSAAAPPPAGKNSKRVRAELTKACRRHTRSNKRTYLLTRRVRFGWVATNSTHKPLNFDVT